MKSKNRKLKSRDTKRKSIKIKQKSIIKSPKRITRSKKQKNKIKARFGRNDEHGAGAEEKKEDISHVHSLEEEYLKFYDDLPFDETIYDDENFKNTNKGGY